MKKELLLLGLFLVIVFISFFVISHVLFTQFVSAINNCQIVYFTGSENIYP